MWFLLVNASALWHLCWVITLVAMLMTDKDQTMHCNDEDDEGKDDEDDDRWRYESLEVEVEQRQETDKTVALKSGITQLWSQIKQLLTISTHCLFFGGDKDFMEMWVTFDDLIC